MPIFDLHCRQCGFLGEVIQLVPDAESMCPECGSTDVARNMSPTSTLTGKSAQAYPGPGDTACCGSTPGHAGCAGPGSCCGKNH